jgi:hypothetical protein
MKKTLIALAALAAFGTASAQVILAGSASVATQKNLAGTNNGLAMTDNSLYVSATEDLGGGMSLKAAFTIENDTNRGAGFTRADQSFAIVTPMAILALANARSGGAQGASLIAPVNLADDQWSSNVIKREAIDAASLTFPMGMFGAKLSYVEGKDVAGAAASGATAPGSSSYALGGTFAQGPLSLAANFTSTTFNDTITAALTPSGSLRNTSTDFSVKYDAGVVAIAVGYDSPRRGKPVADGAAMLLGVKATFGQLSAGINYGKRDAASFMQLGAQYDLSKRTNVNASFGNDNQGTAGAPINDQYRLSLNHSF